MIYQVYHLVTKIDMKIGVRYLLLFIGDVSLKECLDLLKDLTNWGGY